MKLYLIVDATLSSGLKAAQAVHAFHAFVRKHPTQVAAWEPENNVVVLQSTTLADLARRLEREGLAFSVFHEPDLKGQLTALCVEPRGKRCVRTLPLAC